MCVFNVVRSVFDNKNGGPYLFYQRQFWSCVKVREAGSVALLVVDAEFKLQHFILHLSYLSCEIISIHQN